MVKCCGFVEFRHELGKKMHKSGKLQKISTNKEFFIIWRFPFPDGTVMSSPVLRKVGTIMLRNGLGRMAVLNHKLDQMLLCPGTWPSIVSCVTTFIM
jgi:hypothetical protein